LVKYDEVKQARQSRRSVRRATELFAALEPGLADSLFDWHFLSRYDPTALLGMRPSDLALEWTRQFRYGDERQRMHDVRRLTQAAAGFLDLLRRVMREGTVVARRPEVGRRGTTLAQ